MRRIVWCRAGIRHGQSVVALRGAILEALFSADESGRYYYDNGWNRRAMIAFALAGIFSISTVWVPALESLSGFSWVICALLGAVIYYVIVKR